MIAVFDELAYGPSKTLDLHAASPRADEATRRTEAWLRERQVARAGEVLVIAGRGARSADGIAVLRPAVEKLLTRLRHAGVVAGHRAHGEGAFAVQLAPVQALFTAARRARDPRPTRPVDERAFSGLGAETRDALRVLATRTLESLGAPTDPAFVEDEMRRQLSLLTPALPIDATREATLRRICLETTESLLMD